MSCGPVTTSATSLRSASSCSSTAWRGPAQRPDPATRRARCPQARALRTRSVVPGPDSTPRRRQPTAGYQQLLQVDRGRQNLTTPLQRDPYRPHLGRRPRGPDRPGRHLHPGPANPPPPPTTATRAVVAALEITPP